MSESSSRCSGERLRVTDVSIVAMRPISVDMPVAVTTIAAVPLVTEVFWKRMFVRSPRETSPAGRVPASFGTGALSPVSAASCVSRVADRRMRPSAGTMSPASSVTMSPGTMSTGGQQRHLPVAEHLGLRNLEVGERVHAGSGLELLARSQHDVEQDQERHDQSGRELPDGQADDHDCDKHDVHRVAQLLQRDGPHRGRRLPDNLVRPVLGQPGLRLGRRQAPRRVAAQCAYDLVRVLGEPGLRRRCACCRALVELSRFRHRLPYAPVRGVPGPAQPVPWGLHAPEP